MNALFFLFYFSVAVYSVESLSIDPSFLLLEENWPLEKPIPVTICPGNARILIGDSQKTFSIVKLNDTCASLQLNRELDADKENSDGSRWESFSLVFGGPKKSRANLEIQVVDVNDNPPEFINPPTTISVPEDTPEGSAIYKLRTRDPDTGIAGMAFYSVDNNHFSVDKRKCSNGECWTTLRVKEKLDFETKRRHEIIITARDGDPHKNNSLETNITVSIHVVDAQDQSPVFITDLSQVFLIDDNSKVGDVVFEIRARDGDESTEKSNRILYSIQENEYFEIDEKSGNVKLKQKPNGELNLRLAVTAIEDDEIRMKTEGEIKVKNIQPIIVEKEVTVEIPSTTVESASSNGLLCAQEEYNFTLKEGSNQFEKKALIRIVGKYDLNSLKLKGGEDLFTLSTSNSEEVEIGIEEGKTTDYEEKKEYRMKLVSPSSSSSCDIIISINDVNDNSPQFISDSYLFYVVENSEPTLLGQVLATDADSSLFGPITYQLIGSPDNVFNISNNGNLHIIQSVDRETNPQYTFTVRATDAGDRFTDVPVKVVVKDENDNPPVFESENVIIDVVEETASKHKITARDADLGENSMITYTLENVPEGLPIDMNNGILFIGKIDRDSLSSNPIHLILVATDGGDPSNTAQTNITINVEDTNDNRPQFVSSHYSFVVDKNISIGESMGKVEATDNDATPPNNRFYFTTEDERFYIDSNGNVIYNSTEGFGKDSWVEFKIWAIDEGEPSLNTSCTVAINEHRNNIGGSMTTKMNRNESEKREVKWANARMVGYTYEILKATANGVEDDQVRQWVEIDRKTGVIQTIKKISPDSVKEIKLSISMKKKRKEIPVELIIKIVDKNDNSPFFKRTFYRANVTEDVPIGTTVLKVQSEGTEEGNTVKYSLQLSETFKSSLEIDNSGVIRTSKELDFEQSPNINGTVLVVDSLGHNATTNFTIFIGDVNDNRPIFQNGSIFSVRASELTPIGAQLDLSYPLASDRDTGRYGKILYSIIGGENFFTINEKTSVIRLKKELDYETQRTHSLTVRAVDNMGKMPNHEVFASVTVYVEDANDNSPIIHNSDLTHLSVTEDAKEGDIVAVISVTDSDSGGSESVSIVSNHSLFRVNEDAKLVVASPLGGYAGEKLCGVLTASDSGIPSRSTSTPFCVSVQGTTKTNLPLIIHPKPNSIHYFDENQVYTELLTVKVMKSGKKEKEVTYKLDEGYKKDWEHFSISSNGTISSRFPFDYEKKALYEIRVNVCNVKRNCSSINIFIAVNDKNDNCPIFKEKEVHFTITENERSPIPRMIGKVPMAIDGDTHVDNKKICYTVDSPLFFFQSSMEPVLYTNRSFDREQHREYRITITATDCSLSCSDASNIHNSTINGIINIEDLNDNFPKFAERIYYATVIQGQNGPGSHITTITANDPDDEPEGLRYSIKGVVRSEKQSFALNETPITVDSQTGEISAADLLREPSYQLTLSVIDGAGHEDTVTVVVSVVTYDQQTELLFDAPFDYITRNEKNILRLLSTATSLTVVIDRCRQNSNFTVVLAHFLDDNGKFVDVEQAISLLMHSTSSARSELKNAYGLREATAQTSTPSKAKAFEAIVVGGACSLILLIVILLLIWCRQKNDYSRKLRAISAQAAHLPGPTPPGSHTTQKKGAGLYWAEGVIISTNGTLPHGRSNHGIVGGPSGPIPNGQSRAPPAPPPLQSTEL